MRLMLGDGLLEIERHPLATEGCAQGRMLDHRQNPRREADEPQEHAFLALPLLGLRQHLTRGLWPKRSAHDRSDASRPNCASTSFRTASSPTETSSQQKSMFATRSRKSIVVVTGRTPVESAMTTVLSVRTCSMAGWLSCPVREERGDRARSSTSSEALPDLADQARTSPRLGDRIWTSHELGLPADLGASWIHGFEDNPIARLARRQGSPGRNPPVVQRRRATIHAADDDHFLVVPWLVTSISIRRSQGEVWPERPRLLHRPGEGWAGKQPRAVGA